MINNNQGKMNMTTETLMTRAYSSLRSTGLSCDKGRQSFGTCYIIPFIASCSFLLASITFTSCLRMSSSDTITCCNSKCECMSFLFFLNNYPYPFLYTFERQDWVKFKSVQIYVFKCITFSQKNPFLIKKYHVCITSVKYETGKVSDLRNKVFKGIVSKVYL